jgi:hypothetical protein
MGIDLVALMFFISKIALTIFAILHMLVLVILLRQVVSGDRVASRFLTSIVLFFGLLHVILLLAVIILIVVLPQ